ncbi:MAG: transcriptional regulator NrdR [Candidatus Omnitrophica bacterium]|nr:transcriptional regulator NrdR [Candidatus Omnitrophota bacterium]MCM8816380.1 transcriptional regulator NrdR [Candidatus Omnitrophota bacterium]
MRCPYCGSLQDRVIDSRESENGLQIRRRRECLRCEKRFTTYEEIEETKLIVVKKDGRREKFSREKIFNGIQKACEKRPVSTEQISSIVDEVEQQLKQRFEKEVNSQDIGNIIVDKLRKIDEVAYVRFASVYRQFKDVSEFQKEVEKIKGESDDRENKRQEN